MFLPKAGEMPPYTIMLLISHPPAWINQRNCVSLRITGRALGFDLFGFFLFFLFF